MILSNVQIVEALSKRYIGISGLAGMDPGAPPFNTSSVDLTLSDEILVPKGDANISFSLREKFSTTFLERNWTLERITETRPFKLVAGLLVLGRTVERVEFPILPDAPCYSARVEGRSSHARLGLAVHLTAPTIHANFEGTITLEMINFGPYPLELTPGFKVCQLIVEAVDGTPVYVPNQFRGQGAPQGPSSG